IYPEPWLEGPVQPLVRKLVSQQIEFVCVLKEDVKNVRLQKRRQQNKKLKGKGIAATKLCIYAGTNGYDSIIHFSDADREQGTKNSPNESEKRFKKVYSEIIEGVMYEDQIVYIPMVALKMIESWLLSDEGAFERCFGQSPESPQLPKKPELIWGKKEDPQSDYPKNYLKRVLAQFKAVDCRETYFDIANAMDVDLVKERCSISFRRFYEDIKKKLY
ncbi:MAG: DUF4276 family protein, partial [Desulfamplus sp.]|nr:DUF4276 family protein [Desulfamplus sp.]